MKQIQFIIVLLFLLIFSGCNLERESNASTVSSNTQSTLVSTDEINIKRVYPANPIVAINGSIKLTAIVTDSVGEYLQSTISNPVTVTWSSSAPSIATVNQNGTVIGKSTGTATISLRAAYDGYTSDIYTVAVNVVSLTNDVAEIYLSPDRAYVDIEGERVFKLTAVDYYGAQTSISPGTVTFEVSDGNVAAITPTQLESNDSKVITVTGKQKGYVFITPIYTVDNGEGTAVKITGSPLVLQVKDATESSKPDDDTVDAGNYLSMAVDDFEGKKVVHVAHYDKTSNDLMYSFFNGSWRNETVVTNAGKSAKLVISPFEVNEGLPLLLFLEDNIPKLWFMRNNTSDWIDSTTISEVSSSEIFDDANNSFVEGERMLDMSAFDGDGNTSKLHILFYDKTKKRINITSSAITSSSWFNWNTKYYFDLDADVQSLSVAHNQLSGDARFVYVLKESEEGAEDGGVYYASLTSGTLRHEQIPNTNGTEQDVVLKLDSNNVPTVVWHTDSEVTIVSRIIQSGYFTWMSKNISIEPRPATISSVDFSFDAYNTPRIVFSADNIVKYARRITSTSGQDNWIVETPEVSATTEQGAYSAIAVDSENRAHLVYTDSESQWFSYWAEPNFFDYRVFPDVQDIQADVVEY